MGAAVSRAYPVVAVLCAGVTAGVWLTAGPGVDIALLDATPDPTAGEGYATSATCLACHPAEYDAWHRSFHRTMTQLATPSTVLGAFDGLVLEDRGQEWRLERRGDEFWVEMPDPYWFDRPLWFMQLLGEGVPESPPRFEARVVMTTGSHHLQNYWVRRPAADDAFLRPDDGALVQLPWIWLVEEERWVPNKDSFLGPPSPSTEPAVVWNAKCSQCHSVGPEPRTSESFDRFETRAAELGIACEACHGPAEDHVRFYRSPVRRYLEYFRELRAPDHADPTITNPAKLPPERSLETCGQCHSFGRWRDQDAFRTAGIPFRPGEELHAERAVFRYTDDPGDPLLLEALETEPLVLEGSFWRDGTIRVAGREYNGLLESPGHAGEISCVSCHSMHSYASPDTQIDPAREGDRSCTGCHADYAEEVSGHTRHARGSPGSVCMNCHMPHTTYGLFSAMRSHRIDSPSVHVSAASGRPNACNLCHLDESLGWTAEYLTEWYGQPPAALADDERSISAAVLWILRGDAVQRTILGWHLGWRPAREASGESWLPPYLAQLLADPYAVTRQVAYRSLRTFPGFGAFAYDYTAAPAVHEEKAAEVMALWRRSGGAGMAAARLLIGPDGDVNVAVWLRLLAERDHRPVMIVE